MYCGHMLYCDHTLHIHMYCYMCPTLHVLATSVLSSSSLVSPPSMGTVSDDHRCDWCGRVGAGGYAPDALVPTDLICTTGPQNCLAKMIILDVDRAMFRERQLHGIAQAQAPPGGPLHALWLVPGIALCIAGFL